MGNKLVELLKIESLEIASSFQKASLEGEGTPQEVSDRREGVIASFLGKYFPFPYRITKGNIIDSYGKRSNSIDCIILNPSHPYTIDPSNDKASIIFADGVDYAIEVKPDLADKEELERGLKQIQSVKKLERKREGLIGSDYNEEKSKYLRRVPAFIFADKTYSDVRTLISNIVNYYIENNVPRIEQFDLIVINNRMIIYNSRKNSSIHFKDVEGIVFNETKENTLAEFLFIMNRIPKSEPEISKNIISIYLEDMPRESAKTFIDLNNKLLKMEG